jgi:hypothetical protein
LSTLRRLDLKNNPIEVIPAELLFHPHIVKTINQPIPNQILPTSLLDVQYTRANIAFINSSEAIFKQIPRDITNFVVEHMPVLNVYISQT